MVCRTLVYSDICSAAVLDVYRQIDDPNRTILGENQEKWFSHGFGMHSAKWNFLGQTTMFAPFDYKKGEGESYENDGWDGFPAARQRIIDIVKRKKLKNCVSVGGNIQAFYAGDVYDPANSELTSPVMSEIVGTSTSCGGGGLERLSQMNSLLGENQWGKYFEFRS